MADTVLAPSSLREMPQLPSFEDEKIEDPIAPEASPGQSSIDTVLGPSATGERPSNQDHSQAAGEAGMAQSPLSVPLWRGKKLDSPPAWSFPVPFVTYATGGNSENQIWGPPPRTVRCSATQRFMTDAYLP